MEDSQRESMEVDPPEETVSAENSSAEKNIASNIEITGPSKEKDNSSKDLEADGDCSSEKGSKTLNKGTGEEASVSSPSKVNDSSNDESSANVDPLGTESGNSDCEKDNENSEGNQSDSLSNSDGVCTKNNSEDSASHQADQQQSKSTFNASVSEKDDDTTHTIICNSSNSILDSNVLSEEDNLADDDDDPMEVDKEGGDVTELDKQGGDVVEVDKEGDVMEVDKQGDIIELDKQGDVVEVDKQGGDVVEVDKQGGDVLEVDKQGGDVVEVDKQGGDVVEVELQGGDLVEVDKQGGDLVEVDMQGGDVVEVDMQGGDVEANEQGGDVVEANKQGGDALENEKQGENVMETDRAKTDKEGGNERFGKEKSRSEEKDGNDTENRKEDSEEDIVEVPVYKKPAVVVDLALDDEADDTNKDDKTSDKNSSGEESNTEGSSRRIKLRSLASLVDTPNEESSNVVISTVHPDVPAIGEIVEHGVIIGSDEMGGLQLRISNVVGGEDCITGLSLDEDRDSFSHIQISSVTTLMDPMSPEDPNQGKDDSATAKPSDKDTPSKENSSSQELPETEVNNADKSSDAIEDIQKDTTDESNTSGIKIVNSESLSSKSSDGKDTDKAESAGPKIRLSSAVSEVAKDMGTSDEAASTAKFIYHILRSILTVNRECVACCKSKRCDFRITKKNESGTFAFLCSAGCRTRWTSSLTSDHVVEKPRLIFEKMCGMCGKDLVNVSRSGQYSWETREFCTKTCLTSHLNEVAGECHTCREKVKSLFIGKYCVRFGSDIHQFCSNTCLERYKTKIKVCCYCQKNLEKVQKLTSVANKEYCSMKCLKRAQRRDIGQQNYCEQHSCTVCQTEGVNRYEFMSNQEPYQLCSDPCLNVYKYVNRVKAVACCLCFRVLNAEDVCHYLYHGGHQLRVFCSDSCVNVFILSARKIVVCDTCKVKKYNFDMIHRQVDEDFRDYFYCSLNCLNTKDLSPSTKNSTSSDVSSTTTTTNNTASTNSSDAPITPCNMCNNMAKAQYHMVMSDNTLRSFCRYACATKYKNTYGFQVNGIQTDSTQNSTALPPIRPKPSTQVTATISALPSGNEATIQAKKNAVNDVSQEVVNSETVVGNSSHESDQDNTTTQCGTDRLRGPKSWIPTRKPTSGRKRDPVWVSFERIAKGTGFRAICKSCKKDMQGSVHTMKRHLEVCKKSSSFPKDIENSDDTDKTRLPQLCTSSAARMASSATENLNPPTLPEHISPPPAKVARRNLDQTSLKGYVFTTNKNEKEILDKEIANYIYATNSPFHTVEHQQFIKMISKLRPGYVPPDTKQVGGYLLEQSYSNVLEQYAADLNGKTVCLAIDGWNNVHKEPIVCASLASEGKIYLVKSVDTESQHTVKYLLEMAEAIAKKSEENFGCYVRSFVIDNAVDMTRVRRDLGKTDEELITYGCSAHYLNLLAQDLHIMGIKEHITQVIKYFRSNHIPESLYKSRGGKVLLMPSDTCWNTLAGSIQSYLENWDVLVQLCWIHSDAIDQQIIRRVNDEALKQFAEDCLDRLKPITVALDRLQQEQALISDAVEVWYKLRCDLQDCLTEQKDIDNLMSKMNVALTPAHYFANLIDPRYQGKNLDAGQIDIAERYVGKNFPEFLPTLRSYQRRDRPFKKLHFNNNVVNSLSPLAWWQNFSSDLGDKLMYIPAQMHTAVASSAGIERTFSTFGLSQSKIRNSLGNEKASKLVTVFKFYNKNIQSNS